MNKCNDDSNFSVAISVFNDHAVIPTFKQNGDKLQNPFLKMLMWARWGKIHSVNFYFIFRQWRHAVRIQLLLPFLRVPFALIQHNNKARPTARWLAARHSTGKRILYTLKAVASRWIELNCNVVRPAFSCRCRACALPSHRFIFLDPCSLHRCACHVLANFCTFVTIPVVRVRELRHVRRRQNAFDEIVRMFVPSPLTMIPIPPESSCRWSWQTVHGNIRGCGSVWRRGAADPSSETSVG